MARGVLELLLELARDGNDSDGLKQIITEMESRFPHSPWLADALFSAGNMYMLKRDYPTAIEYYGELAGRFPSGKNASAAHWRSGWLSYRLGLYPAAERIFDEQIRLYPGTTETVSALYWRGRLYETQDHNPAMAAANYRTIIRAYQHFFYAQMARQRLAALGNTQAAPQAQLDDIQPLPVPHFVDSFPEDSPHLAKARLLANAGLTEYIALEIKADPNSSSWGALAEGQIYSSYGQTYRAVRALKRAIPTAASASIQSIPLAYWRILFPEPWWNTIETESAKNNLDPYLVASLIRQESEFDPTAVSNKQRFRLDATVAVGGPHAGATGGNRALPDLPTAGPEHEYPAGHAVFSPDAGQVRRCGGVCAGCLQRGRQSCDGVAGGGSLFGARRVCGVDTVYGDAGIR